MFLHNTCRTSDGSAGVTTTTLGHIFLTRAFVLDLGLGGTSTHAGICVEDANVPNDSNLDFDQMFPMSKPCSQRPHISPYFGYLPYLTPIYFDLEATTDELRKIHCI